MLDARDSLGAQGAGAEGGNQGTPGRGSARLYLCLHSNRGLSRPPGTAAVGLEQRRLLSQQRQKHACHSS